MSTITSVLVEDQYIDEPGNVRVHVAVLDEGEQPAQLLVTITEEGLILDLLNGSGQVVKTACMDFEDLQALCK